MDRSIRHDAAAAPEHPAFPPLSQSVQPQPDPLDSIRFLDLFALDELQRIQDAFAAATGVASIITDIDGIPITRQSNFCHLCSGIIRKTEKGLHNCILSDASLGAPQRDGPRMQRCLSGGLLDGGASIMIGERHVANWLIGQVLDDESEADRILEYGDTIGANRDDMTEALKSVKRMTTSQFQDICSFLFLMARQLSQLALNNYLKSQEIQRREWAERILHERNEKLVESYRKLEEQDRQLHFLAYHDLLTGLPGRAMFRERLDMACRLVRRSGRKVAVLYMDIDNFKQINDSFGHGIGDEILIEAGRRLLARIREYDTIARYGGDEFLAVLQDVETPEEILSLATRLHSAFAEPFVTTRVQYHCDISVGIAVYPDDGATVDELLKNADTAMYKAKDKGRNDIQFFNASMREEVLRQSEIERSLWSAMDQQAFFLQYQPQFDVASGAIRGFEALIRWHSPELGLISPLGFIPVAEDTGLIVPIGRWVLLEACRQAQVWNRHAPAPLIMAVNLSAVQLRSAGFLETVLDVLRETGLAPQLLELEITESVLIHDYDMVVSTLQRLRDAGVRIALDDFGTGYSSLSYLKNLPIHMLKIDKAFIEDVCVNPTVCRITESIISLVQKLGIQTVAEGIEDENQFQCLKDIHCDFAQGFHLGRPMDADQVRMPIQPMHHG